jgi:hypothetical protein
VVAKRSKSLLGISLGLCDFVARKFVELQLSGSREMSLKGCQSEKVPLHAAEFIHRADVDLSIHLITIQFSSGSMLIFP